MPAMLRLTFVLAVAGLAAGCNSIGPGSVQRDRISYSDAIATSWREQMLLNIVKLRYQDAPVFLEVSSVISSYTLQTEASAEAQWYPFSLSSGANNTNRRLGVSGMYTDRPTISYTPVTGEKYIEKLLRPIPPQAILSMLQAGHSAEQIVPITVRAMNDVYNFSASPSRARSEDPAFYRVVQALRRIQLAGALGVRIERRGNAEVTLLRFRDNASPEVDEEIRVVRQTLGIKPEVLELTVSYGSIKRSDNELVLLTRSMWEILAELSSGVDVPEMDRLEGRAAPSPPGPRPRGMPVAHVHSGTETPTDAFASVRYRNYWFWIDDRDLASKRIFTFLMVFSSIAEKGTVPQVPIITIPAN